MKSSLKVIENRTKFIDLVDDLLPQTQCGLCGYGGCKPYARAISNGEEINKCPPGGQETVDEIAAVLGTTSIALEDAEIEEARDNLALIVEDECIGCTKCIAACPVDAIFGAAKLMHTVLSDLCTGCGLCLDPCPVDCIVMIPRITQRFESRQDKEARNLAKLARNRFNARNKRLERSAQNSVKRAENRKIRSKDILKRAMEQRANKLNATK